ncbi:sulfotransferase [Novosphingobium sp.]|uniref:tetratricopeptide repeat-containing sulfotransferase family protein n=1 Tax=Novosphingobium sp. TaxID=1874826 RepID=UPI003340FC70
MSQGPNAPALVAARLALGTGDFARAAQIAEGLARADPALAEARFVLGVALAETGHMVHALGQVQRAADLAPDNAEYAAQLARLLIQLQRDQAARDAAVLAMALPTDDPLVLDTLGCVLARLGDHGDALPLFARAVGAEPDVLSFRFNYASSLGFFGETEAAAVQYEAMIARDPANGAAHYGLAGLARQTAQHNHIARIEAVLPAARDHGERVRLHYAAAKEHEDLGASDAAFAHLDAANRAHKAHIGYRADADAAVFAALQASFADLSYFSGSAGASAGSAPIFIVGLPRTGTTLVDRILGAQPLVHSLGELQAMPLAIKRLTQTPSRLVLDDQTIVAAGTVEPAAVAAAYMAQVATQAGAQAAIDRGAHLVDKFPLNFLYVGYIARAFPDARIVCLRRDPMDSVWSNFKHLFALASPYYGYSYDVADTARYYAGFARLMAFWRTQFPASVMELRYEDLLADPEAQTRALLAHCGLPWDAACLDFHKSGGAVATPSAQQVRRPINSDSLGRWKRYAAHMAPVRDVFRKCGIAVD